MKRPLQRVPGTTAPLEPSRSPWGLRASLPRLGGLGLGLGRDLGLGALDALVRVVCDRVVVPVTETVLDVAAARGLLRVEEECECDDLPPLASEGTLYECPECSQVWQAGPLEFEWVEVDGEEEVSVLALWSPLEDDEDDED